VQFRKPIGELARDGKIARVEDQRGLYRSVARDKALKQVRHNPSDDDEL
jgi:hypothetical protein